MTQGALSQLPTVLVLLNPDARRYGAGLVVHSIRSAIHKRLGPRTRIRFLRQAPPEALPTMIRQACLKYHPQLLLIGGGDGTVQFAIQALLEANLPIPIGLLPMGTGNLLAKSLTLPQDWKQALTVALSGLPTPIKLARLTQGNSSRVCAVGLGSGLDVSVMHDTPKRWKRWLGQLAYVIQGVLAFPDSRPFSVRLTLGSGEIVERTAHSVLILVQRNVLNTMLPIGDVFDLPECSGLDVCITHHRHQGEALQAFIELLTQQYTQNEGIIEHWHTQRLSIQAEKPVRFQVDGDLAGTLPAHCKEEDPLTIDLIHHHPIRVMS